MNPFSSPEFLAVGHVTHDLSNGQIRLGGAAFYAALTAHRMGKRTALFTSYGRDFQGRECLEGILTKVRAAPCTSTFQNAYQGRERCQLVCCAASSLDPLELPPGWKETAMVYLCPVLHEVPSEIGELFPASAIGVAPQGWLRIWDQTGRIRARRWEGFETLLQHARVVVVSEKDIEGNEDLVDAFRRQAPILIVTRAERGAFIFAGKETFTVGAYPAVERDPTGAGDCFGAAFLVRHAETGSVEEAGRFASCVGSLVVEREGIEGIPNRDEVLARMALHSIPIHRQMSRK